VSIWVSVYCRKRLGTIRPARFVAAIKERVANFAYLYAQEDPDESLARLRLETYKGPGRPGLLHLHYLKEKVPIVIDRVTNAEEVEGGVREYLEEFFRGRKGKQATRVRKHLGEVVEIVNFCLKQLHADGMGTPITYAAAAWLAEAGDGLVRADEQGWMERTARGDFALIVPE
jgi:hypothetical protein